MTRGAETTHSVRNIRGSGAVAGLVFAVTIVCLSSYSWIRSYSQITANSKLADVHVNEVNKIVLSSLENSILNVNENNNINNGNGIPATADGIQTSVRRRLRRGRRGRKPFHRRRKSKLRSHRRRKGPHRRRKSSRLSPRRRRRKPFGRRRKSKLITRRTRRRRRGHHRRRKSRHSSRRRRNLLHRRSSSKLRSRRRRKGSHRRRKSKRRSRRRIKRRNLGNRRGRRGEKKRMFALPRFSGPISPPLPLGRGLPGKVPLFRGRPLGPGPNEILRLEKERAADAARRLIGERRKELRVRRRVSNLEAKLSHERARELAIRRETLLLKKKAFKYGVKYPKTCSCYKVHTNSYSNCYYFTYKADGTCARRQCRTSYKCAHGRDTGVICMRRLTKTKIVPIYGGKCKEVSQSNFMYVPYSYGYGRY